MTANANKKPGCLSTLFPFLKRVEKTPTDKILPYHIRDDFLSPAEFSFYKVLLSLAGTRLTIQAKVGLAEILFVPHPNENFSYLSKIRQKHLDFLICDSTTMKPLMGIELDDSSHNRSDRQERDEFVEKVFQSANLPLLRVPAQREYNTRELAAQIAPLIKSRIDISTPQTQPKSDDQLNATPLCPKCGIPMVIRTVTQGDHKGKQFYGCRNYPQCREMKPVK